MTSPTPRPQLDPQQGRRRPTITVAPYILMTVLAVVTVIAKRQSERSLLVDLALCALAVGWMLTVFTTHPAWRDRPPVMAAFLAVLIVIMMVLVVRDPWFGFFTAALYVYAFRLVPWPGRLAGVAAVATVSATAQAYAVHRTTLVGAGIYLAVLLANVIPMCGFAVYAWRSSEQNAQRERALAELSQANRKLEAALAENVGLHEQLLAQARQSGVHDERQRMAREIHDTLAQGLTGIITQLQAASHASQRPVDWRRHLDAATNLARESLSEARRSVHELRPAPLQTARLAEALAGVTEHWSALHGVAVQIITTGTVRPMPPQMEFALLRTAQEALANVAKHAHATRVGVTLSYLDHEVALDVRDDGMGFEPAQLADGVPAPDVAVSAVPAGTPLIDADPSRSCTAVDDQLTGGELSPRSDAGGGGGFGLVAMRQRIEGLSGTLQIESQPGAGTGISACVPLAGTGAPA